MACSCKNCLNPECPCTGPNCDGCECSCHHYKAVKNNTLWNGFSNSTYSDM